MKAKVNKPNESKTGNSLFSRSNNTPFFTAQAKLNVGKPGDKYKQEADRVADKVVQGRTDNQAFFPASASVVQNKSIADSITPLVQRAEDEEAQTKLIQRAEEEEAQTKIQRQPMEEEEEMVQPKTDGNNVAQGNSTEELLRSSKGNGSSLNPNIQTEMEHGFGADFSGVKIHTNSTAVQMNKNLGAQAFTTGNNIYFNEGKYQPDSKNGKALLAHELTHTVQQGSSQAQSLVQRSTANEAKSNIEDAASGWGTDEEGIFSAIRECTERSTLRNNSHVRGILNDELSGYDLFKAKLLLKYGTESSFPPGILNIWHATDGAGTNEEMVYDAIRSSTNRRLLQRSSWVTQTLNEEMSGHDYAKTQLLFRYGTESSYPNYVTRLWTSTVGLGTNESDLFSVAISLSPTQIAEVKKIDGFVDVIRDELSWGELARFNRIVAEQGPAIQSNDSKYALYGSTQKGPIATSYGDRDDTNDYSPDDVNQGFIGDCYFLASLAAIARSNPSALKQIISKQSDGSYNLRFYVRNGSKFSVQIVNVTARFPRTVVTKTKKGKVTKKERATYAWSGDKDAAGNVELWVMLLEKGYAKLRGSYDAIEGGFEENALEALLGQEAEELELSTFTNAQLVARVRAAFLAKQPVTAGTISFIENGFTRLNQIVPLHAYTVLSITDKTISLRNPHGESLGLGNLPYRTLPWNIFRRYFGNVTFLAK